MNLGGEGDIARADAELPVLFFPFDLLYLDGFDLRRTPLGQRIEVLARVLRPGPLLQPVQSFEADGKAAYEAAVAFGFEGVVAKRRDGAYLDGRRSRQWLKVKARRSADFVVGGWRAGEGARAGSFGALLLGAYDEDGALRYAGRVGSGFSDRSLEELRPRLDALAAEADPFADAPPEPGRLTFVRPELVAEVEFANWTSDGRLRAPVFLRLRDDKPPSEVLRADAIASASPPAATTPEAADHAGDAAAAVLDQLEREGQATHLDVIGVELAVSNLDKVLWPETAEQRALTKRDLLRYLATVSPWLLPHLRDRPLTLTRYPNGIEGGSFYQKHYDRPPPFVETVRVYTDSANGDQQAILCNNLPTLLWLGQLADLELHVSLARVSPQPDAATSARTSAARRRRLRRRY